jgi:hypothetical protein
MEFQKFALVVGIASDVSQSIQEGFPTGIQCKTEEESGKKLLMDLQLGKPFWEAFVM